MGNKKIEKTDRQTDGQTYTCNKAGYTAIQLRTVGQEQYCKKRTRDGWTDGTPNRQSGV